MANQGGRRGPADGHLFSRSGEHAARNVMQSGPAARIDHSGGARPASEPAATVS